MAAAGRYAACPVRRHSERRTPTVLRPDKGRPGIPGALSAAGAERSLRATGETDPSCRRSLCLRILAEVPHPPRWPNPRLAGRNACFGKGLATISACFHAALVGEAPRPQKTCFFTASGRAAAGSSSGSGSQRRSGITGRPTEPSRPACLPPRPGRPASPRLFAGHSPGPPFPPLRGWAGGASGKQCSGSRHGLCLFRGLPQRPE